MLSTFRHSIQVGLSFGLMSGAITTLGLIVGLAAGTQSRLAVIGGIVTIAIADALSDALGIHVAEEAENVHSEREIWAATGATFVAKLIVASSFLIPVLLFDLVTAVAVSVAWGITVVTLLSFQIARTQGAKWLPVVAEHVVVAALVVAVTHVLGTLVAATFGNGTAS